MNFPKNETNTLKLLRGATAETQERVTTLVVAMLGDPRACDAAAKALKAFEGPLDPRLYRAMALLAVRSDLASGFNFGDASSIYFCIPGAALAKADFAKAFCVNDE